MESKTSLQRERNAFNDAGILDECKTSFGQFLKDHRESKGLTQSEVAAKLGYGSPQFISNIERGVSNVPMKSLRILIGLYGLSPANVIDQILMQKKKWLMTQLGVDEQGNLTTPPANGDGHTLDDM